MLDYESIPLHWINRLGFLIRKKLGVLFDKAGHTVSPEEWAILLVLWQKGPQSPSALADVTFKDRTTVTRLIDAMVLKKLVTRTEDALDRRRSVVALSARGEALEAELVPLSQSLIAQALVGISPEDIETTTRTLKAMVENLSAAQQSAFSKKDANR